MKERKCRKGEGRVMIRFFRFVVVCRINKG